MLCPECGSAMRPGVDCEHCAFLAAPRRQNPSPLNMIYTTLMKALEPGEVVWFEGMKLQRDTRLWRLHVLN